MPGKRRVSKRAGTALTTTEWRDESGRLLCGARRRSVEGAGLRCRNPAGFRTDHFGEGRCFMHGGRSLVKHGRYSTIRRDSIRDLIEQHEADPDPLNILPELAATRALFQDYVERYDAWREAVLAWHASYQASGRVPLSAEKLEALRAVLAEYEEWRHGTDGLTDRQASDLSVAREVVERLGEPVTGKPTVVLDLADAYRILSEITKMAERIETIRARNVVSRAEMERVLAQMWRSIELRVTNESVREQIRNDWVSIHV